MSLFIRSASTPMPKNGLAIEAWSPATAAVSCERSPMARSFSTAALIGAAPSAFRRTESSPIR